MKKLFVFLMVTVAVLFTGCIKEASKTPVKEIRIQSLRQSEAYETDTDIYLKSVIANRYVITGVPLENLTSIYGHTSLEDSEDGDIILHVFPEDVEIKGQKMFISYIKISKEGL